MVDESLVVDGGAEETRPLVSADLSVVDWDEECCEWSVGRVGVEVVNKEGSDHVEEEPHVESWLRLATGVTGWGLVGRGGVVTMGLYVKLFDTGDGGRAIGS